MLDDQHTVYLWQGWWPVGSYDSENVHTGSATARFNMDRRCAMETVLHYCKVKNPSDPPPAYLVCAGVEPKRFTALFPYWNVDTIVRDIASEEGKPESYQENLQDVLQRLTQTRYSLARLQERPLPEGVDPLKLEAYLDDEEFQDILEMDREEFYQLPAWKQKVEKQRVGLF
ncbi:supervillin [Plakobranchus ocellatus]|uniref:Supervillin n=1 Tax=Plakobranchus ocellatus TaxID=259542 RepID=A0AAV3ZVB3_9GAST|nr:supervillin [Plakobranchus ocellatus]